MNIFITGLFLAILGVAFFHYQEAEASHHTTTGLPTDSEGAACLEDRELEEKNKELIRSLYHDLVGNHDVDKIEHYFHHDIIHHNPLYANGIDAIKEMFTAWFRGQDKFPTDIRRISVEGNVVWVHHKVKGPDGKTELAIADIFRLEDGKVVEFWDVVQPIDLKTAKNSHPYF